MVYVRVYGLAGLLLLGAAGGAAAQTDTTLTTSSGRPLIQKSNRKTVVDQVREKIDDTREVFSSSENLKKAAVERLGVKGTAKELITGSNDATDLGIRRARRKVRPVKSPQETADRNAYAGILMEKVTVRKGSDENITAEEFYVLKSFQEPSVYVRDIWWYDEKAKRITNAPLRDKAYARILHGPYRRSYNGVPQETGFYYVGTKDGRWEKYGRDPDGDAGLQDKQLFERGFPEGSVISYYDAARTKIREVVPVTYGQYSGLYRSFYESGQLREEGVFDDSVRVNRWRQYYEYGPGGRTHLEIMFGKDRYDVRDGVIIREYDNKGKLIYENKEPFKEEEEEQGRF